MDGFGAKVNVAVRVRPLIERELGTPIRWFNDSYIIEEIDPLSKARTTTNIPFTFDHVFGQSEKTGDVYKKVVEPIVNKAFKGYNGTVMCYGQTSSGKTYTLYGSEGEEGIISTAANDIFNKIQADTTRQYSIKIGLIEIYNEKVGDLFSKEENEIKIVEMKNGEVVPNGLKEVEVFTSKDLENALEKVQHRRRVGETRLNVESSRSHTIVRIQIESIPLVNNGFENSFDSSAQELRATLNFVDLAGSEKVAQTGAIGDRFTESKFINKSLSHLAHVMMQLSEMDDVSTNNFSNTSLPASSCSVPAKLIKPRFVNYRDSKLTRILQSSLSGNAYITLICNVTPATLEETRSTLNFARTAKKIDTKPKPNLGKLDKNEYEKKLSELHALLASRTDEVQNLQQRLKLLQNFVKPPPQEIDFGMDRRKTCDPRLFQALKNRDFSKEISEYHRKEVDPNSPDESFTTHSDTLNFVREGLKRSAVDEEGDSIEQTYNTQAMQTTFNSSSIVKRLKRDEGEKGTPVSTLRQVKSMMAIAWEEDRQEALSEKELRENELIIANEELKNKEESLAAALKENEELKKVISNNECKLREEREKNEFEVDALQKLITKKEGQIKDFKSGNVTFPVESKVEMVDSETEPMQNNEDVETIPMEELLENKEKLSKALLDIDELIKENLEYKEEKERSDQEAQNLQEQIKLKDESIRDLTAQLSKPQSHAETDPLISGEELKDFIARASIQKPAQIETGTDPLISIEEIDLQELEFQKELEMYKNEGVKLKSSLRDNEAEMDRIKAELNRAKSDASTDPILSSEEIQELIHDSEKLMISIEEIQSNNEEITALRAIITEKDAILQEFQVKSSVDAFTLPMVSGEDMMKLELAAQKPEHTETGTDPIVSIAEIESKGEEAIKALQDELMEKEAELSRIQSELNRAKCDGSTDPMLSSSEIQEYIHASQKLQISMEEIQRKNEEIESLRNLITEKDVTLQEFQAKSSVISKDASTMSIISGEDMMELALAAQRPEQIDCGTQPILTMEEFERIQEVGVELQIQLKKTEKDLEFSRGLLQEKEAEISDLRAILNIPKCEAWTEPMLTGGELNDLYKAAQKPDQAESGTDPLVSIAEIESKGEAIKSLHAELAEKEREIIEFKAHFNITKTHSSTEPMIPGEELEEIIKTAKSINDKKPTKINRGTEPLISMEQIDSKERNYKIKSASLEQRLRDMMKKHSDDSLSAKVEIKDLKAKYNEAEAERQKISNMLDRVFEEKEGAKDSKTETSIQCDLFKEMLDKSRTDPSIILPYKIPNVRKLEKRIVSLENDKSLITAEKNKFKAQLDSALGKKPVYEEPKLMRNREVESSHSDLKDHIYNLRSRSRPTRKLEPENIESSGTSSVASTPHFPKTSSGSSTAILSPQKSNQIVNPQGVPPEFVRTFVEEFQKETQGGGGGPDLVDDLLEMMRVELEKKNSNP